MRRPDKRLLWILERAALIACALLILPVVAVALDKQCSARIELVFAGGIVQSAQSPPGVAHRQPRVHAAWIEGRGPRHVYDLTGPGADALCRDGVALLQRDPAIVELRVVETTKFY
jgi:hypothetical protein